MPAAKKIVDVLTRMGHEVLTRHLVSDDAREVDRRISPQEVYARDMNWLRECDLFIAEVSGSTFGLGFETGYLLGATAKTVILFYRRELADKISLLIAGNAHPNCRLAPYSDLDKIENLIAKNLSQVHFTPSDGSN